MTKQEFLAISLPHKLICKEIDLNEEFYLTPKLYSLIELLNWSNVYQPILHPLSDLTKEIEHNGEKFVPYKKLSWNFREYELGEFVHFGNIHSSFINIQDCFKDLQLIISWHFDTADLISIGEAIDINTLPINPYK